MSDFRLDTIEQHENERTGNVLIFDDGVGMYKCIGSGVYYEPWLAESMAIAGLCEIEE